MRAGNFADAVAIAKDLKGFITIFLQSLLFDLLKKKKILEIIIMGDENNERKILNPFPHNDTF